MTPAPVARRRHPLRHRTLAVVGLALKSGRPRISAAFVAGILSAGMVFTGMVATGRMRAV
jgi:hypothetical protein